MPWTIIASLAALVLAWPVALAMIWRPAANMWLSAAYAWEWLDHNLNQLLLGWPFWCLFAGIMLAIVGLVQRSRYRLLALGALLLNLGTLIAWVLCVIRALFALGSTFK